MATKNQKVMEMVEKELRKNPDIENQELREKATKIDKSVSKLSARQFNATYPLQVKRAMKPRKSRGRKKKSTKSGSKSRRTRSPKRDASGTADRDAVRDVLLDLARDVAAAEGKGEVVDVVAGLDAYVNRVMKAAR